MAFCSIPLPEREEREGRRHDEHEKSLTYSDQGPLQSPLQGSTLLGRHVVAAASCTVDRRR